MFFVQMRAGEQFVSELGKTVPGMERLKNSCGTGYGCKSVYFHAPEVLSIYCRLIVGVCVAFFWLL